MLHKFKAWRLRRSAIKELSAPAQWGLNQILGEVIVNDGEVRASLVKALKPFEIDPSDLVLPTWQVKRRV